MQNSLRRLALIMIYLLILVATASSMVGYLLLQNHYATEQDRFEAEAIGRLEQSANALANQIEFYQGILHLLANRQSTIDLLVLEDEEETLAWTARMRELIPAVFGTGLAQADGRLIGDPPTQRVGDACLTDLSHFSLHRSINYPPIHANVPGLEHFDLMETVTNIDGTEGGTLMISFRLVSLDPPLRKTLAEGDSLRLMAPDDQEILTLGTAPEAPAHYIQPVRGTAWVLHQYTAQAPAATFFRDLLLLNLVIIVLVTLVIDTVTRRYSRLLTRDMRSLQQRICSVMEHRFDDAQYRPQTQEIASILPDLDRMAHTILDQQKALHEKTLIDPLTGVRNRRHFDLLIEHVFEHSRRHLPAAVLLIIDLNKFKQVNDTLGHKEGDKLLIRVARFLQDNTRSSDEVARLGGDEFAVILQDIDYDLVDGWLQGVSARFDEHVCTRRDPRLPDDACTLSIGAAAVDAAVYASYEEVVHNADLAMYRAKTQAEGHSRFHKCAYHPPRDPGARTYKARASTTNLSGDPGSRASNG